MPAKPAQLYVRVLMAATCPSCGASLNAFCVRSLFVCKSCAAQLRGRTTGPLIAALVLWQLADLFIYPMVLFLAGDSWPALLARTAISACVGFPLYAFLIGQFATVEVTNAEETAP
jgi:hypothetical protein